VLEDAERLIAAWNERQEKRMPMLFSPTISATIAARSVGLLPGLPNHQCARLAHAGPPPRRSRYQPHPRTVLSICRPNASFAELVRLSRKSIADEMRGGIGGECSATAQCGGKGQRTNRPANHRGFLFGSLLTFLIRDYPKQGGLGDIGRTVRWKKCLIFLTKPNNSELGDTALSASTKR